MTEREHWLSITEDHDWKRNHIFDPDISQGETVAAIVSAFPDDPWSILEIGCGFGRLTQPIADLYPNSDVIGIDVNPDILPKSHAQNRTTYRCADHLRGITGLGAIYSVAVFQHLPSVEKRAYIEQSYDALQPDGVLRIQFIEGDRDKFCDHLTPLEVMIGWFGAAGFTVTTERGLAHPQWTWITGVK